MPASKSSAAASRPTGRRSYQCLTKKGDEFRNTEFFVFAGDKVKSTTPGGRTGMSGSGVGRIRRSRNPPRDGAIRHSASKTRVNALKANPPYASIPLRVSSRSALSFHTSICTILSPRTTKRST